MHLWVDATGGTGQTLGGGGLQGLGKGAGPAAGAGTGTDSNMTQPFFISPVGNSLVLATLSDGLSPQLGAGGKAPPLRDTQHPHCRQCPTPAPTEQGRIKLSGCGPLYGSLL
jgi:hypothetical protein